MEKEKIENISLNENYILNNILKFVKGKLR